MAEATIQQNTGRKRVLAAFWARLVCFALLTLAALWYTAYVLIPKHDYGVCSMMHYYRQPRDTVDVLAVGTSIAYAGINTNVLWEEYGIAAYDLCSAEQPFWVTYYTLQEALKTQTPRVILLDAKPAMYTKDYSKRGRIIMSTFGIRSLDNRLGAIRACLEDPADAMDYLLAFPVLHSEYKKVGLGNFAYPPENGGRGGDWKGFIEEDAVEQHSKPSVVWNNVRRSINAREEEYVRLIFSLAQEKGIPLMLVAMPNPDYANDHMYFNYLWSIAGEYGVTGINYNDPSLRYGLRYSSDFADWQHLNVKGSITFSRKLGEDLKALYDLPDRRGDPAYESWAAAADAWFEKLPTFESSGMITEESP